ncbi:unnamed protein product [Sphagnum balticum]
MRRGLGFSCCCRTLLSSESSLELLPRAGGGIRGKDLRSHSLLTTDDDRRGSVVNAAAEVGSCCWYL